MVMIDYGAILKVNGKFINKNKNFCMEETNMGYKPKSETIGGFVIAGDKNFCLTFYKGYCEIFHNEKLINQIYNSPFISETIYNENLPIVKIEHLDKNLYPFKWGVLSWKQYVDIHYYYANDLTEKELKNIKKRYPKVYMKYLRHLKSSYRHRNYCKRYTLRWKATWDYKGNHYEVIYGFGIEPIEEVWNKIKYNGYGFTEIERNIIDEWFKDGEE